MGRFNLLVLSLLFVGCSTHRAVVTTQRDSVSVMVNQREVLFRDTVYFEIEPQSQYAVVVRDSSFLESEYATSAAVVLPDGTLHHTLDVVAQSIEQSVEFRVEVRDSVVYRDKFEIRTVEVERELSWLEQLQIKGFRLLMLVFAGGVLVRKLFG